MGSALRSRRPSARPRSAPGARCSTSAAAPRPSARPARCRCRSGSWCRSRSEMMSTPGAPISTVAGPKLEKDAELVLLVGGPDADAGSAGRRRRVGRLRVDVDRVVAGSGHEQHVRVRQNPSAISCDHDEPARLRLTMRAPYSSMAYVKPATTSEVEPNSAPRARTATTCTRLARPGHRDAVVGSRADDAGDVGAMAAIVADVLPVGHEVPAAGVVDETVMVVVDAVGRVVGIPQTPPSISSSPGRHRCRPPPPAPRRRWPAPTHPRLAGRRRGAARPGWSR